MSVNNQKNNRQKSAGFTILEIIVSLGIFAILAMGMLASFGLVSRSAKSAREKTILSSLSTYYLEAVRNMPYSQVGTIQGNPNGPLPDSPNNIRQTIGGTVYNIYYKVTYIHDPADTIIGNPDYKQVKMSILNTSTNQITDFLTTVVPKGLITNSNTGALQVTVINAQGQVLPGASVNITYPTTTPYIYNLADTSDINGLVTEVGLQPAVNAYRIIATKPGYSTDQTYPITVQNPNPVHPDATIASGTITQLTLSIDQLSNLNIKTLDQFCQPLSGVNVNVAGAKLISTNPDVPKFNNNYSSVNGLIALNNLEWDTYTPTLLTGQSYILYGTSPVQQISVLPGTTQTFTMILGPNTTANSLLVIVKDAATGAPLENAFIHLIKGGSVPQDYYGTTGGSVWEQDDWSGGPGQVNWSSTTPDQYFLDDGNVDSNSNPTGLRLLKIAGRYQASGWAESSTFDTGTSSTNYTILSWAPPSQSASTTLWFQVAANNDNSTWNFVGPNGATSTYFTTPGNDMGSALDNNRYVRYKAYLATTNNKNTPVLTSVNLNYVTGCYTPGQSIFTDLTSGNNYNISVSLAGYTTQTINSLDIDGNQTLEVQLSQ
ncbi:MAG: prepilin-type N-terminal cleavage/methylation domain-containing protein [Candidatus Doudnabacteria bacterium]|nr:prepilin-type N-terminal cleavage/methylation domain-containing protein [Candidatus Doudnabacteria bacterium]